MTVQFFVEAESTLAMLSKVEWGLSPPGMTAFLANEVGPWLKMRATERFASEGDDASGKWAPLKESTQNIRTAMGFPAEHPINRRTGELEDWVTGRTWHPDATGWGAELSYPSEGAQSGSLQEKLRTAQRGKTSPRTPARPVLAVDASDMLFLETRLRFYLEAESPRRL